MSAEDRRKKVLEVERPSISISDLSRAEEVLGEDAIMAAHAVYCEDLRMDPGTAAQGTTRAMLLSALPHLQKKLEEGDR